jgi:putative ABC transport system permease protein
MYKSYFKIGWRNLLKHKGHFAINITGLGLGVATCLLIAMFVVDELSYDRYNTKADRMARIVLKGFVNGEHIKEAVTPSPVAQTLKDEFPEVEAATRMRNAGYPAITVDNTKYKNVHLGFVDPNFFEVFTLTWLKGDVRTALKQPNTVVITQEQARTFFGDEDPLNKTIEIEQRGGTYKVTGIIDEVPANSHFHFDLFASTEGLPDSDENNWMASRFFSYVVLSEGTALKTFESKLPDIITKYMGPQIEQIGMTYDKFRENGNSIGFFVQPLTDIHLFSDFASQTELEPGGNIHIVYIFGAVALFMLVIACINFMNLSTAIASKRSREVGVKKVLGSHRGQLIRQFLTESFIATVAAIVLALMVVATALPLFNELSGKSLSTGFLLQPTVWASMAALLVFITLLAGGYPAFFMSRFQVIASLKGRIVQGRTAAGIRSVLVVFQFIISAGLITAIIIVNEQMQFIQSTSLGYDREQLLVLRESYLLGRSEEVFRNQIAADPRVESVTMSAFVPAGPSDTNMNGVYPGEQQDAIRRTLIYNIDDQYMATMGMVLKSGRNFSAVSEQDSAHVIINETAVRIFELGEDPIGKILTMKGSPVDRKVEVIGVVKDFHARSLHELIGPMMMLNNPYGGLIVRSKTADMGGLIASIQDQWQRFDTGEPFTYGLLNELYNDAYVAEKKMGAIMQIFGAITILIACLGLFGLVTFAAEQKVKEIGIRKVLGANVVQIVQLLSKDLIRLVAVSFVIAFPLGFYLMDKWLQDFAYRISIHWWIFAFAGGLTMLIAFATISIKTIHAAVANPVDALRNE